MKSLQRLLGLFLLSLFLAACWLSTLPGAEDPWDENKVVQSDSGTVLGDNGIIGDDGPSILIITDGPGILKLIPFRIVVFPGFSGTGAKGCVSQHAPAVRVDQPSQSWDGEIQKTER